MSVGGDRSPSPRDWDTAPNVVRSRELLAREKYRPALSEAWKAASLAVNSDDECGFAVVRRLAEEIEARASGRTQRQAAILGSYVEHCRDASASGTQQGSLFSRLFGIGRPPKTKKCPECAEQVRAQAKVCRFCGNRFPDA